MAKLDYFKCFPAHYETDEKVKVMNLAEEGLYWRCLRHAWLNDGLPIDIRERSVVLGVSIKELNKLWPKVGRCFATSNGRLVNPRQEGEREAALSKSRNNARAASKRWQCERITNAERTQSECNAGMHSHARISIDIPSKYSLRGSPEGEYDSMVAWERCRKEYPKELIDADCRAWVNYIETTADEQTFFENLDAWKDVRKPKYFPRLEKYLVNGYWKVKPKADSTEENWW